jgi:hypothetical protein
MSKKSKSSSIEIPEFKKPTPPSFETPWGTSWFKDNTYGFTETPEALADRQQIEALRRSILSGLGVTAPEREASLNQWQDTFMKEALRTSMPRLEQTLFERGLGGSRFYQGAITDLLGKLATQSVLNRENLARQDELLKLNQLAGLYPWEQVNKELINTLTGRTADVGLKEETLAQDRWKTTLPYLARVTGRKTSPWGTIGSLLGAAAGAALAAPTGGMSIPMGAALGSSLGGAVGGYAGGSPSQLDLSWLAMMPLQTQQYANIAGMGRVPIAPADYYKSAAATSFLS